jgi:hypothetical protein
VSYYPFPTSIKQQVGLWLRGLPGSRHLPWPYVLVGFTDAADEIPDRIAARTAVVVQSGDRRTWIAFDCPRHRGERIMLNLSTSRRPCWRINEEPKLTLYPSIDAFHSEDRCHFWIKRGRLRWVKEAIRPSERTPK